MFFLKKILAFLKNYWYVPIIGVSAILFSVILKSKNPYLEELLAKTKEKHQKDLNVIEKTRKEKEQTKKDIENKRKLRMSQIEAQYMREKQALSKEKRKEISKIIKKYKNDPKKIAEKLSRKNGWKVVLPDE